MFLVGFVIGVVPSAFALIVWHATEPREIEDEPAQLRESGLL